MNALVVYLLAYYEEAENSFIDLSQFNYEIKVAQALYDSLPDSEKGLQVGASYVDSDSKKALDTAIIAAKIVLEEELTQEMVDNALTTLKTAEATFKDAIKTVE